MAVQFGAPALGERRRNARGEQDETTDDVEGEATPNHEDLLGKTGPSIRIGE